jgi:hypothetical protein
MSHRGLCTSTHLPTAKCESDMVVLQTNETLARRGDCLSH